MENSRQSFKAVSKIVLNNWHYIDSRVLAMHQGINFFTGHSGSGKSTVIDAMQIVLYANTDGRGFFNKAAADDSDRNLIEYLRGMINIGENGQAAYKRNKNFSTTIVLELTQTLTGEQECVGVIFDVDVASNDYNRLFFWHRGAVPEDAYRKDGRVITISELKAGLAAGLPREDYFYTTNNERYRRNLYDIYLGGLDMEKFPRLFKRAIPFRMNIKLEDFVKEYICMEQDIHIEEMQESVILYGRMRKRIEDTRTELERLEQIEKQFLQFEQAKHEESSVLYRKERLHILALEQRISRLQALLTGRKRDAQDQKALLEEIEAEKKRCQEAYDQINRQIAGSGYSQLEAEVLSLEESIELLSRSENKWKQTTAALSAWEDEDVVSNQVLWDVESFCKGKVTAQLLERLKKGLKEVREEAERQRQEASGTLRSLKKESNFLEQDLMELRLGRKAYPKELESARRELRLKLYETLGKDVPVRILADLLDIRDEKWRNAIEGYLGNNKLALVVEPKYIRQAMELYSAMDRKNSAIAWDRISLVDTEKLMERKDSAKENSLAAEVIAGETYVSAFVNYLLGNVIKCDTIKELRECRVGVTADCMLYQNFQLRRLNPDQYTRRAFIGEKSMRERQKELQSRLDRFHEKEVEQEELLQEAEKLLSMEYMTGDISEYLEWYHDIEEKQSKESRKRKLEGQMKAIGADTVDRLLDELRRTGEKQHELERQADDLKLQIHDKEKQIEQYTEEYMTCNAELLSCQKGMDEKYGEADRENGCRKELEREVGEYLSQAGKEYDKLLSQTADAIKKAQSKTQMEKNRLIDVRSEYLKSYPERNFAASAEDNEAYRQLVSELSCDKLLTYEQKAALQARIAVEHFKEDFIYKIRSAIREAYIRRDELNRIIRNLNFGKDRYQFKITRSRGQMGEYYDMFMDETLQIDPTSLAKGVESQMNLFSMAHESKYGVLMNELIRAFIPPENATAKEQEEALQNMTRYSDYRSYLSFEMEQIVEGEEQLVIGLSKMIKKNSGGEGQNPLYVALLASFAQAYKINLASGQSRRSTLRLVVLDEAFSKMDAEKVASCIQLIRGLGFQAIISATNDKIQNYLENVDKTFVYANPNKKNISIQEFEKREFGQLGEEM